MELSHLKEFVYLADTLSFKQTADYFYASRSVISRHLAGLEEDLGAKLIDRTSHSVKLTRIGEMFYRDAVILLRDYETALEHVRIAQNANARIVRIGYLRNTARSIIVQFVLHMKEHHPELKTTLSCMEYSELRSAIGEGDVDVALGVNVDPSVSRHYRSTLIYTDQFYAIMGENNPLASKVDGIEIADIPPDKLLLPDSFVHSGQVEMTLEFDDAASQAAPKHEHLFDVDEIFLKLQTENYVVFSPNVNTSLFGENLVCLPVLDIDSTFSVSAFYRNGFEGEAYEACKEAFEACRPN